MDLLGQASVGNSMRGGDWGGRGDAAEEMLILA